MLWVARITAGDNDLRRDVAYIQGDEIGSNVPLGIAGAGFFDQYRWMRSEFHVKCSTFPGNSTNGDGQWWSVSTLRYPESMTGRW
jgi:hypothetical protein